MAQTGSSDTAVTEQKINARGFRILMLVPAPGIRGPLPKHTPLLVNALRQSGCFVATVPWGRQSENESLWTKLTGRTGALLRVLRVLRGGRFDIMLIKTSHTWASLARDVPLALITRGGRCRAVVQFHGSSPEKLARPGGGAFKASTRLLINSTAGALVLSTEELVQWQRLFPGKRFYLVENAFLPNCSGPEPDAGRPLAAGREPPVLLFVGRLIPEKGALDLLNAFALVRKEFECELVIVGDGPLAKNLRRGIKEHGLEEDVRMPGYLEGKALAEEYCSASILALPTYYDEGFPTVFSEAMAGGLPIVTTRVRGAVDHLREGVNALFVPPRDPPAIAQALKRLLADPGERGRMGEANRSKVKDFVPEKVMRRYIQAFKEIM